MCKSRSIIQPVTEVEGREGYGVRDRKLGVVTQQYEIIEERNAEKVRCSNSIVCVYGRERQTEKVRCHHSRACGYRRVITRES